MPRPYYVLFAGVNGAGKSTFYHSGMWQHHNITDAIPRVNPDEILAGHGWDPDSKAAQLRAGREALGLVKAHLAKRESFNQETTLSGRSIVKFIRQAHESGYCIVMFFIAVERPSIAQARIAHRKETGGHFVDPKTVERRFAASVDNLIGVLDICDEAYLYDNTTLLNMVARFELGELAYCAIENPAITWHHKLIAQFGYEPIDL